MANASTYQCPNCDGVLQFNAATGMLECEFCGGVFTGDQIAKAIPMDAAPHEVMEAQHVKTVEEFLDNAPWQITNEGTAAATTVVRYSCPSCGAGIVADQSTISTSCPYCGNNMFVAGIASQENIPHWIIPFSVTREQADALMHQHFLHKWYLSRKFSASLQHMQAVYVPYYLYDINVNGWADYIAYNKVESDNSTSYFYYGFKRAGNASFQKVPVDGSSKMPDAHMDAIAPFNFANMRAFAPGYAAGYLMEVADESVEMCQERAESLARNSFEEDMKQDVLDEKKIDGIEQVVSHETTVQTTDAKSCVLPVWLMHCTWEEKQMLFAVNGETGKCVGDLPISSPRRGLTVGVLVVLLAVLAFMAISGLTDGWRETEHMGGIIGGAIAIVALIPISVDHHFKKQMLTAVEATNAGMSYDSQGLVITERWRTAKSYGSKKKALTKLEERNAEINAELGVGMLE